LRNFLSVSTSAAAAQRLAMAASRQRVTLRVRRRKPDCGLSMKVLFPTSQGAA